jgi:hypothetical protein
MSCFHSRARSSALEARTVLTAAYDHLSSYSCRKDYRCVHTCLRWPASCCSVVGESPFSISVTGFSSAIATIGLTVSPGAI